MMVRQRKSFIPSLTNLSRSVVAPSRESWIHLKACIRTAGPRYLSPFHQYDGHDVEQQAQRMHSYIPSNLARSSRLCKFSCDSGGGVRGCSQGLIDLYWAKKLLKSGTRSLITGICGNGYMRTDSFFPPSVSIRHRHASVLLPFIFIAHDPQIPSRQERRKVSVGSISFLILIRASSTMGPHSARLTS